MLQDNETCVLAQIAEGTPCVVMQASIEAEVTHCGGTGRSSSSLQHLIGGPHGTRGASLLACWLPFVQGEKLD